MPTSIDSLQIEINAKAQSANTAIDRLVGKLDRLNSSLRKTDGANLSSLANGVDRLGRAMQTMNTVKTADFTRLAKNLSNLNNLDSSKLSNLAVNVNRMATSFSGLSAVSDSSKQLAELANGISRLGYKSSEKAITNIPKLADSLNRLMTVLSKSPKVSRNVIDLANALANLASKGSRMGTASNILSKGLNTASKSAVKAKKSFGGLASAFGKFYATYWVLIRAFSKLGESINIASDLTEVQNVVDATFGKYSHLVDKMAQTSIPEFGMSELTVKQISSRFQAMGTAMGFAQGKMADMSLELTALTADMASFYNMEQKDVAEDLEAIFTGQTRPMRTYGIDLTQATLQEWALNNGMNANIKTMSQAEKTLLRYQYVMSRTGAAQGDFLRTQNTWANQVRILRQQFEALGAVIGGTLINALKPLVKALNAVMSKIISFAQTVSNALGKIFGWKYEVGGGGGVADDFEDAAGSADDMAGSTGKAADNAKKLKQQLQGFDELNVLTSNDDADAGGGSGGGAGAGGGGGAGDGGWVRGETIFEDYESELDTLYELGDYIGTKLSEAMESIDWDSVYEKARNFGTGLASFLNGLISPRLFGNLGKTIANSLNTVLYGLNFFGRQFDWTNYGVSIATGIKSFFENFDFGLLADTLSVWVKGLAELITSTLDEIKDNDTFKTIGQKIVDFISGIDWFGVTWRLTDMFESFAEAAVELPLDLASGIAQGIADKIFGEGKVNIEIPEWMVNMGKIAMGIVNPFYLLVFAIGEIKDRLGGMGTAWKDFQAILAPIVSFVSDNLMVAWNELAPIFDEFATYYVPRLSATFENLIQNVLTPLASLIKTILSPIVVALSGYLKTLWQNVIVPLASAIMSVLSTALMGVSTLLTTTVNPAVKIVINTFEYLWKKVFIPVASYVTSGFKNSFSNAFTMIKGLIEGLKTSLNGLINFITGVFSGNWSRAWNGVKDIFKGAFNMIISVMEGVLNNIINGINTFFSKYRTALNKAASAVGVDISIGAIPPISIPRFEKGGYPKRADLFYANENGVPELVGTMNGKTAVTSGKEITGISDAIYTTGQTEASLLNTAVGLLRIIAEKEYGITQDAIGRSARNYAMEYQRRTGRPAYDF